MALSRASAEVRLRVLMWVESVMRACILNVSQTTCGDAESALLSKYCFQSVARSSSSGNKFSQKRFNHQEDGGRAWGRDNSAQYGQWSERDLGEKPTPFSLGRRDLEISIRSMQDIEW